MPCDTQRTRPDQTLGERKVEVRDTVSKLAALLASGAVKPVVGPQGAIAFPGWLEQDRRNVTDACAFRLLLTTSPLAMQAVARAEALAGRSVDRKIVGVGAHAHSDGNGGLTWHSHKG